MFEPILAQTAFTPLDWGVVVGFLVLTTVVGARLAGKQATIRDFFLGGRKLPWYAVAGSIVATEISAVTFVSVPSVVWRPGGDFTYLQLGLIGSLIARLVVGYVLVPAYYEREIYSPYDYIGAKLGAGSRKLTTALFGLGGILAQSARVYLTAEVLNLILGDALFGPLERATGVSDIVWSIWAIGLIAVIWTLLGGIATVIWTDVILFLVFLLGAVVALITITLHLDGGWTELIRTGHEAGKFRFLDFSTDPTRAYTFWCAVIAVAWGNIGIFGTDQLMAQRMFCCRGPREARRAIIASIAGVVVTATVMLAGVGLFAYYGQHPLHGEHARLVAESPDRIFPIFIVEVLPPGLTGLLIAGIFAAAISSLDSILAALSQTTLSAFVLPARRARLARLARSEDEPGEQRLQVWIGRGFVVLYGVVLCCTAQLMIVASREYDSLLDLALAMAGYTSGALLAAFLLAFLRLRVDGFGLLFGAPLSILFVVAAAWREPWAWWTVLLCGVVIVAAFVLTGLLRARPVAGFVPKSLVLGAAAVAAVLVQQFLEFERPAPDGGVAVLSIAWPWFAPLGCTVAFVLGLALGERREAGGAEAAA